MFHPTKAHIRQITGLTVALTLVGTLGYVVTRTAALERRSTAAARTQDITLDRRPALPAPVEGPRGLFMGRVAGGTRSAAVASIPGESIGASTALTAFAAGPGLATASSAHGSGSTFGTSTAPGRAHSASAGGFSNGSFGMSGAGAWGGVSGVVRPTAATAKAAPKPKAAKAAKSSGGATSGRSRGGSSDATPTSTLVAFSQGAAAIDGTTGIVAGASGQVTDASPASSPSPTPEPMSLLLVGTGLVGLYKVRRYVQ